MKLKITMLLGMACLSCHAADNTWTGCYAGVSANHTETKNQWTTTFILNEERDQNAGSANADDVAFGIQFGCDFLETEHSVWGLKVTGSNADLTAQHLYIGGTSPSNTISYQTDDIFSIVGKYGYKTSEKGLLYGQLGYLQSSHHYEDNDPGNNYNFAFQQNVNRNGLLMGVGYEHLLSGHFSLFAEYNFTDFGKEKNVVLTDTSSVNIYDYMATIDQNLAQFSLGVNYRF